MTVIGALGTRAFAAPPFSENPFSLGVASGDPSPDGVVLWTRLAPQPLVTGGGMPNEVFGVRYEVAEDEGFRDIIRRGAIEAIPDEAHSVRVELEGLEPAHEYFYRFKFGPEVSPHGRTRTAPARDHKLERLVFAFVSCQNFPDGYFTPYQEVAESDEIHAVVHLGDYIYEGPSQTFRKHEPLREIFSLDDYRIRHAQYKTDVHLQAAHAAHPWLVTWDDHEFKNNYADLDFDPDVPPEVATARRAAAYRAYWEHMPLRRSRKPEGPSFQLYRRFHWGDLVTFNVLDGRQYRSDQPAACTRRAADAERLLRRRRSSPGAPCSAPSSATGCSRSSPPRPRAGTCSPSRRRSRRSTTTRARRGAASGRATTGTATSPSGRCCSTGWSPSARRTRS